MTCSTPNCNRDAVVIGLCMSCYNAGLESHVKTADRRERERWNQEADRINNDDVCLVNGGKGMKGTEVKR